MNNMFFRKVQRAYPVSKFVNIPKEVSTILGIDVGDTLIYVIKDGVVEIRKATT